jgi:hypothetical protein
MQGDRGRPIVGVEVVQPMPGRIAKSHAPAPAINKRAGGRLPDSVPAFRTEGAKLGEAIGSAPYVVDDGLPCFFRAPGVAAAAFWSAFTHGPLSPITADSFFADIGNVAANPIQCVNLQKLDG